MGPLRVLLVDDEELVRWSVGEILRRRGDDYALASDGPEALEILEKQDFDVMITDLSMPEMKGLEVVKRARAIRPQMVSIILTGLGTREDVLTAMKEGVFDFIDKPVRDVYSFSMAIQRAGEQAKITRERDRLLADLRRQNARLEVSFSQLHDAYVRLQRQEEALEADLRRAQRMHHRLLPVDFPRVAGLDFFGYYRPCERLGGDFFGVIPLERERVALYLADVAGHGVAAAMITVIIRELIHAHRMLNPDTSVFHSPPAALEFINRGLLEEAFDPVILVTMVYAVVDAAKGDVEAACAGHPPPILVTGPGRASFLPSNGPVLGIEAPSRFIPARFSLAPGDLVLLYSDGLTESRNAAGEEFSERSLTRTVGAQYGQTAAGVGAAVEAALSAHEAEARPEDDQSFLVVARTDRAEERAGAGRAAAVKIAMPRASDSPMARLSARLRAGWSEDAVLALRLEGKATWRQAPALRALLAEAKEKQARRVVLDLTACLFLDSTLLGLLYRFSSDLFLYGASRKALEQFRELGLIDSLRFTDEPPPAVRLREPEKPWSSEEDHTRLILSAHESLMEVSEENKRRFDHAVEAMRRGKKKAPGKSAGS